jgi:(1->4)-alpha-D-glucan 1-alpha-D-glucosylmutase
MLVALWHGGDRAQLTKRLCAYMQKAAREAKVDTSWVSPNPEYEADLRRFVADAIADDGIGQALSPLAEEIASLGFVKGISQLVLKLTAPGVPDFYQGTELLDLTMVDPDNRWPVDFELRRRWLAEMAPLLLQPHLATLLAWARAGDARLKLYVTARLLRVRGRLPDLFAGEYNPLELSGEGSQSYVVYERSAGEHRLLVVVNRSGCFPGPRADRNLRVLAGPHTFREVLTGAKIVSENGGIPVTDLPLPWAVLHRGPACF